MVVVAQCERTIVKLREYRAVSTAKSNPWSYYATGAQRDSLQQNPSGLGRQEEAVGRELNGYVGPR